MLVKYFKKNFSKGLASIITTFILFSNFFAYSQVESDSLASLIASLKGEEKFEKISELASSANSVDEIVFWADALSSAIEDYESDYWKAMLSHHRARISSYQGLLEESLEHRREAISLFKYLDRKDKMARQYLNIGNAYADMGEYDSALTYYSFAKDYAIEVNDTQVISGAYTNISTIYHERGDQESELKYLLKALELSKQSNDSSRMGDMLFNLAVFYMNIEEFEKCKELIDEVAIIHKANNNLYGQASVYNLLAGIQFEEGNLDSSLRCLDYSIEIYRQLGNVSRIATIYLNQGQILGKAERWEESIVKLKFAYDEYLKMGEKKFISIALHDIGTSYEQKGEIDKAIDYLKRAIAVANSIDALKNLSDWNFELANLYKNNNQLELAFDAFLEYDLAKDSMLAVRKDGVIREMEGKYQNEKKQLEIDKLESEQALKEAEIAKQNSQRTMMIGGLTLSALIILIVSLAFLSKKKDNQIIGKQKGLVELKNSELNLQKDIVEEKNREITDSIIYAKRIQEAILPPKDLFEKSLGEGFVLYIPKSIVAGDFYWMNDSSESNSLLFAAADCTGHGVPGALVSVVCSNALNQATKEFKLTKPSEILSKTREIVIEHFSKSSDEVKDGMDISFCSFNAADKTIEFAGAQNPLWIIRRGDLDYSKLSSSYKTNDNDEASLFEIKGDKQPIGVYDVNTAFTNHKIQLQKGDSVYLFSDGFADQFGGINGKKLKYKGFKDLILAMDTESMQNQNERIQKAFYDWKGDLEQLDDICVIGMKVG